MKKQFTIVLLALGVLFTACQKKQQQPVQTPVEQPATIVEPQPEVQPDTTPVIVDTIKPVAPVDTVSIIEPIDTILHDIDTIVKPVEGWTPQYKSAYGKGMVTILYKQRQFSSPVVVHYLADSLITASVQPMFGIEMYRLEAHRDKARLYEKLNRRYVEMTYEEISAEAKRTITFPLVEQMVEEVGLTYPVGKDTTVSFSGVKATLLLQYRAVNQPISVYPISTTGYSRTTLKALLNK